MEIEVYCSCGTALVQDTVKAAGGDSYIDASFFPCTSCIEDARDESYSKGVDAMRQAILKGKEI